MRSALPDTFVGEISGKAPTGRSCKRPFVFETGTGGGLAPLQALSCFENTALCGSSSLSSYDNLPQETIGFWVGTREA